MKTTKEERAGRLGMLEQNVKDGGTFHRGVLDFESRLIADVNDAAGLLENDVLPRLSEHVDPLGLCRRRVADFLKEPK